VGGELREREKRIQFNYRWKFQIFNKKRRGGIRKKKQFFLSVLVYLKTRENILFADIQENCGRRWDYIDEEMMPNTAKVNREPNGTEMA